MPLFDIVKSVMDSNGWPQPVVAVSSSQDQNMRQAVALANKALTSVSFKSNWPVLTREYQFTTITDQMSYSLPLDFHHIISPSAVNADMYYALKGSMTPLQWYRKHLNGSPDYGDGFRIDRFGKQFNIAPTPSSPVDLVFMYISNQIAMTSAGVPTGVYAQDTDEALVDEDLIEMDLTWRWREKKGMDYTAEMAEAVSTVKTRFAQYLGYGELPVGRQYAFGAERLTQPFTGGWYPDE
jgi:hypothetical protein